MKLSTKGRYAMVALADLALAEQVVIGAGLIPFAHDDYQPGRRFYFLDWDGIEFEVVTYALPAT